MICNAIYLVQNLIAGEYLRFIKNVIKHKTKSKPLEGMKGYEASIRTLPTGFSLVSKPLRRSLQYLLAVTHQCDRTKECGFTNVNIAKVLWFTLERIFTEIFFQRTLRLGDYETIYRRMMRNSSAKERRSSEQIDLTTPTGISAFFTDIMACLFLKYDEGEYDEGEYVCDLMHLDNYERRPLTVSPGCIVVFDKEMNLKLEKCRFADRVVDRGGERLKCQLIASSVFIYATVAKHLGMVHYGTDSYAFNLYKHDRLSDLQAELVTGLSGINDTSSFVLIDIVRIVFPFTKKGILDLLDKTATPYETEFDLDRHIQNNDVSKLGDVSPLFRSLETWWLAIKEHVREGPTRCLCFANVVHELYSNPTLSEVLAGPSSCVYATMYIDTLKPNLACSFQLLKTLAVSSGSHGRLCDILGINTAKLLQDLSRCRNTSLDIEILHPDNVEYSIRW